MSKIASLTMLTFCFSLFSEENKIIYPFIQAFSFLKNLQLRSTINRAPRAKEK